MNEIQLAENEVLWGDFWA